MSPRATHDGAQSVKLKKRFTREQLLRNLQILGTLSAPLPPDLPPSPPASRSPSPVSYLPSSSSKRKLDSDARPDADPPKRPRTTDRPHKSNHLAGQSAPASHSHKPVTHGSDPHEEGEVEEDVLAPKSTHLPPPPASASSSAHPSFFMPVRRPRRGKPSIQDFDRLHDKYHSIARKFKYSGDARFWSTYPPSHKHFKPLLNPPALGSPYHTHGGLMSRLELIDALLCFVYALWCQDYSRGRCASGNWRSSEQFLSWCKGKWEQESTIGVREKAFIGLILMIEAFIHQRRVQHAVKSHMERDIIELEKALPKPQDLAQAARTASLANRAGSGSQHTPPGMLPSPASTLAATSTNSTPTNPSSGTPNGSGTRSSHLQPPAPSAQLAAPVIPPNIPVKLDAPVPQPLIREIKDVIVCQNAAAFCMNFAQSHLSLAVIREHFPRTFGRMVHSSLTVLDEHEPDMEDDEGELFWPNQCVTGDGLGWVCLMGRSMVKEFGKEVGYTGMQDIIPKPDGHK